MDKPEIHGSIKETELQHCALCKMGVMHHGDVMFYRFRVQSFIVHLQNVQRQSGLTMMLGGHAALANVIGENADMAQAPCPEDTLFVCMQCAMNPDNTIGNLLSAIERE